MSCHPDERFEIFFGECKSTSEGMGCRVDSIECGLRKLACQVQVNNNDQVIINML